MASIRRLLPGLLLFAAVAPIQAQGIGGQACYYARGKKAGSAVKPCWDKSYGISHCCQAGDLCLSDLSCWDPDSGATYQYGCTDPDYIDDNCPKKCGLDTDKAPWVGLMYCGEGSNLWVCNHPDTCGNCSTTAFPPNVQSMPPEVSSCKSLQMTAAAFVAEVSLTPILSLPTGLETETLYFSPTSTSWIAVSGYIPTWITDAAVATSSAASTDNDNDDESSSSSGLSTAAKAGIGAGAGVVALGAIGAAVLLLLRKRRGHKEPATLAGDPDVSQPMMSQSYGGAPSPAPGVFYDYRSNTGSPDLSSQRMSHPTYGTPSPLNSTTSPSQTPYQDSYMSLEQQHGHIHPEYTGQTHVSELPVQRDNLHELA